MDEPVAEVGRLREPATEPLPRIVPGEPSGEKDAGKGDGPA